MGVDPCPDACCRDEVDAFEVVGGQDFEGTCGLVGKYGIGAIVTAATDKPLVMMARVAEKYGFPFYSVNTAVCSTDKFLMKECFEKGGVPHARGRLVASADDAGGLNFPLIVKPRDNSGSRGVVLCGSRPELESSIAGALFFSRLDTVLVEEFIEGPEYSIESVHYGGRTEVIQFTEKQTTAYPYNVELAHRQPAGLSDEMKDMIRKIVSRTAVAMGFEDCPSHTELKINGHGVFVIETSPRLGGDCITSDLVPLSTGINIEDLQLDLALGIAPALPPRRDSFSAVRFFDFPEGTVKDVLISADEVLSWKGVRAFDFSLSPGKRVPPVRSSLDRYGSFIVSASSRGELDEMLESYYDRIRKSVIIDMV